MKFAMAVRMGVAVAALLPWSGLMAQGAMSGEGMGHNRPPFERTMGPKAGGGARWWNNPVMVEKLKLSDDQRKAMDQILLDHKEKLIDLRAGVEKAELAMEPLMGEDQPNEAKILAQIDKVAQARAELEKANARFLLALRGKLSAEQWKALQAERANRQGGRERGWGGERQGHQRPQGFDRPQRTPPPAAGPQGMNEGAPEQDAPPPPLPGGEE
jgi:Spy/CpxP family protein refolding chaperone